MNTMSGCVAEGSNSAEVASTEWGRNGWEGGKRSVVRLCVYLKKCGVLRTGYIQHVSRPFHHCELES